MNQFMKTELRLSTLMKALLVSSLFILNECVLPNNACGESGSEIPFSEETGKADKADPEKILAPSDEKDNPAFFAMSIDSVSLRGQAFNDYNNLVLSAGKYTGKYSRAEAFVGIGSLELNINSKLSNTFKSHSYLYSAGIVYKYFLTPRHTLLGLYFLMGGAENKLFWSYKTPRTNKDGHKITDDHITGKEAFVGIGANLLQTKKMHVGGEIVPSYISWESESHEGFKNDILDDFWMIKLRAVITFI